MPSEPRDSRPVPPPGGDAAGPEELAPPSQNARSAARIDLVTFAWFGVLGSELAGAAPAPSDAVAASVAALAAPAAGLPTEGVAQSCDLSRHGVGMLTAHRLVSGTLALLELRTSIGMVHAVGRVMHCASVGNDMHRIGIRFVTMPPGCRLLLDRLARRAEQQP